VQKSCVWELPAFVLTDKLQVFLTKEQVNSKAIKLLANSKLRVQDPAMFVFPLLYLSTSLKNTLYAHTVQIQMVVEDGCLLGCSAV
jgi:hypothetical protein